jgi:hypothetical protein
MGIDTIVVIVMVCVAGIALVWVNLASRRGNPPKDDQERLTDVENQEDATKRRTRR